MPKVMAISGPINSTNETIVQIGLNETKIICSTSYNPFHLDIKPPQKPRIDPLGDIAKSMQENIGLYILITIIILIVIYYTLR
jgi:hypothetical protein